MLQDATCNSSSMSIDLICVRHHRFFTEMAMYALDVLAVVTLVPATRRPILGARMRRSRMGISILLGAAAGHTFMGNPEVHALCRFQSLRSIAESHPHARNPTCTTGKGVMSGCSDAGSMAEQVPNSVLSRVDGSGFVRHVQVMAAGLVVLGNCLLPPAALEPLLPAAGNSPAPSRPVSPGVWLSTMPRHPVAVLPVLNLALVSSAELSNRM